VDVTAAQLRDTILGTGLRAVGDAVLVGADRLGTETSSAGVFSGDRSVMGMPGGIVLSTGYANSMLEANSAVNQSGLASQAADTYLNDAFNLSVISGATTDTTSLTFQVELEEGENDLYVSYLYASEEYGEAKSDYADVMGVFVDDNSDGTFSNIALVPRHDRHQLIVESSTDYTSLDDTVFTISDGTRSVTFEFDAGMGGFNPAHHKITFDPVQDDTREEIANLLVAEISHGRSGLMVVPENRGGGVIELYGAVEIDHDNNPNTAPVLQSRPSPDVSLQYQAAVGHLLQSVSPLHVTTNSITGGYPLGQNASNSQWFVNNDPSVENKSSKTDSVFDGFTTVLTGSWEGIGAGTHTIHLTVSDVLDPLSNDSALFVLAGGVSTQPLECEDLLGQPLGRRFDFIGHENTARTQGQLLIESNSISRSLNHGLVLDSTFDDDGSGRTYPGGPRNLREINHAGLVPGVAVYNNT
ncbi:MAG: hypothetical protein GY917_00175, partial [Planctomycetaceae bacterium]|nr:hypothetical protein [Planctomycetaceae bacterium]